MVFVNTPVIFTDTSTGNVSVSWDFGDVTPKENGSPISHTFSLAGTYRVTATITSPTGEIISCYRDIDVTSPTTGALDISSSPLGAKIFINGSDQGKVTRSIIQNIPVGSHSLKLTLPGYQDYTIACTINAGLITVLKPTLILAKSNTAAVVGVVAAVGITAVAAYLLTKRDINNPYTIGVSG
jgi:PKD repeat protein